MFLPKLLSPKPYIGRYACWVWPKFGYAGPRNRGLDDTRPRQRSLGFRVLGALWLRGQGLNVRIRVSVRITEFAYIAAAQVNGAPTLNPITLPQHLTAEPKS